MQQWPHNLRGTDLQFTQQFCFSHTYCWHLLMALINVNTVCCWLLISDMRIVGITGGMNLIVLIADTLLCCWKLKPSYVADYWHHFLSLFADAIFCCWLLTSFLLLIADIIICYWLLTTFSAVDCWHHFLLLIADTMYCCWFLTQTYIGDNWHSCYWLLLFQVGWQLNPAT